MTVERRTTRRRDALSKERIVEAAIDVLDTDGDRGQVFRALTVRLSTGVGAIYHHVANKNDLLAAAADAVIAPVMSDATTDGEPEETIRAIALGIFDSIDAHPWVGAQLSRDPRQPAVLHIWEGIGGQLNALGITGAARSDAGAALVNYVLGSAAQHAAGPGQAPRAADRSAALATLATEWEQLDPAEYPMVRDEAARLGAHDDRAQFLAGVDIFLAGIRTL
ncbi:TetR/AcrR family transcriptional regulator [Herbiconiux ginsengi]|uniref:Transcriptional regulator, TetR family n=1 Tax=Herbiconiux ginsengi TaxID=381665 RepID=A0A1H3LJP7_9MICO|nr:TetR/AcrR family transcriptional regulator C-terminal domain-containing protein [Herbiconiux ginsengi]SDY64184.1 transcriptional regulator, TetR family [Herbiconiux ginsengi]